MTGTDLQPNPGSSQGQGSGDPARKPVSSLSVADVIVQYGLKNNIFDLSNMKLNKLVYIAHGWHLGFLGTPLVEDEEVEAWPYGPVFPNLYCTIKLKHVKDKLPANHAIRDGDFFKNDRVQITKVNSRSIIEDTCSVYKNLSAVELYKLTHKRGTPWDKANSINMSVIPNDLIQGYYKGLLDAKNIRQ